MTVDFNEGYFEELSKSEGVQALVHDATERIADAARKTAPVDTGAYERGIGTAMKFQKRAVGLVIASDPKSMLIEAKTGNLARALRAAKR